MEPQDGEFSAFSKEKYTSQVGMGFSLEGWAAPPLQRLRRTGYGQGTAQSSPGCIWPSRAWEGSAPAVLSGPLSLPPISWTPPFLSVLVMYLNLLFTWILCF